MATRVLQNQYWEVSKGVDVGTKIWPVELHLRVNDSARASKPGSSYPLSIVATPSEKEEHTRTFLVEAKAGADEINLTPQMEDAGAK
jgi:hypothetical protein